MRTQRRKRKLLGTEERFCRVCNTTTTHQLEHSEPVKRLFGRGGHDYVDLDERDWAKCTTCGYRFALGRSDPPAS